MHEQRQRLREMFVPLRHDPGHAQVDFGEALVVIAGEERKISKLSSTMSPTTLLTMGRELPIISARSS